MMDNSNSVLAEQISRHLLDLKLIPDNKSTEFKLKLETGKLTEEDWRFYLESVFTASDFEKDV